MRPPRRFRWGFVALGVVLVALIVWAFFASQKHDKPRGQPPVPVTVAKVTSQDVPVTVTALGAAQAWQGVLIVPQISGRLLPYLAAGEGSRHTPTSSSRFFFHARHAGHHLRVPVARE